jgi:exosome complex component RRP41
MSKELLFISDYRIDGRKYDEIRDINIETDILPDCNGSAMITMGATKCLAWVNGPHEGKSKNFENKGTLKCIFSIAPFASITRKTDYKRDLKMREFSKTIKDIFEQVILLNNYSKSEIEINILVLQSEGSYKSAAINSVTIALINAGILLKDTVVGMTIGLYSNIQIYDLCLPEEKENIPLLNVAFLPISNKFIFIELLNAKTPYEYSEILMQQAEKASIKLFEIIEKFLKYNYSKN